MSDLGFSKPNPATVVRHKAMDLLARREHSRVELRRKLQQRFPDNIDLLDNVLDSLLTEGLQSDFRFSEAFTNSRVSKGQGPQRIRAELQQRGVAETIVNDVLLNCMVDWIELARQVIIKKYLNVPCNSFSERAKRGRFLQSRGFTHEQINSVLSL